MKKKLKETKFAKIAGSILKGAIKDTTIPFAGAILGAATGAKEGFKKIAQESKEDETGGEGKVNYVRLASTIGVVILVLLFAFGKIDAETFSTILEHLNQ